MRKYRDLTREELEAVESDFVQFLAERGVTAADWRAWTTGADDRIRELIREFSDGFWDRATSRIEFLERRTGGDVWVFAFQEARARLVRCTIDPSSGEAVWYRGEKHVEPEARGREVFLLLEQGAKPCNAQRWEDVVRAMEGASVN